MKRDKQKDLEKLSKAFFKIFFEYFELDDQDFGKIDLLLLDDIDFGDTFIERQILQNIKWEPEKTNSNNHFKNYTKQQLKYARNIFVEDINIENSINSEISGDLVPKTDNTYDLGSSSKQWKDLFVSSGSIYIGGVNTFSRATNSGDLLIEGISYSGEKQKIKKKKK